MVFTWLLVAFFFGLMAQQVRIPPIVGYLAAGFFLNMAGQSDAMGIDTLVQLSNYGITLLLFSIGLKLDIKSLAKKEIWLGSLSHTFIYVSLAIGFIFLLYSMTWLDVTPLAFHQMVLIAFALSFSSTVVVVKLLEDRGEMRTRHGQISIGILIIQDLVAVLFLTMTNDTMPSPWALTLLALPLTRPLFIRLVKVSGHGELMILSGFILALTGYFLFEALGLKGDLGALLLGVLISGDKKADELSKSLLVFKDLFLISFFLSIGLDALPTVPMVVSALLLLALLPVKHILYFFLFTRLQLRTRTAFMCSLSLNNYSEFGLIVAAIASQLNWLPQEWTVVIALTLSFSIIVCGILNRDVHGMYSKHSKRLKPFERQERLPEDRFTHPEGAEVLIVGMGRLGSNAYDVLSEDYGDVVWGVDASHNRVKRHVKAGRQVIVGDAEDADFWGQLDHSDIQLIMLALPTIEDIFETTNLLRDIEYKGKITTTAKHEDERKRLLEAGVDIAFNFYAEAGKGFAIESKQLLD